jgi:hypothetical protein
MADDFMSKLKAGSTVRKLTGGGNFGTPIASYDRFKKHCELNPAWSVEALSISDANGRREKGARLRNLNPSTGAQLSAATPRSLSSKANQRISKRPD